MTNVVMRCCLTIHFLAYLFDIYALFRVFEIGFKFARFLQDN